MIELLTFGEINPDIVVGGVRDMDFAQTEHLIDQTVMTIGSSVAIMSAGAARLGVAVGICGVVGDDGFGRFMIERASRAQKPLSMSAVAAKAGTGMPRRSSTSRHCCSRPQASAWSMRELRLVSSASRAA